MPHRRVYPTAHLTRLITKFLLCDGDDDAWKPFYYIYWMYEQSLKQRVDGNYGQVIEDLCSVIHTRNVACEDADVETFLVRFRSLWPNGVTSPMEGTAWARCNDLIQWKDPEAIQKAKVTCLVEYIMNLFTMIPSFAEVLTHLDMNRAELWTQLTAVEDIHLLIKIIRSVRTLDAECFIGDEDNDCIPAFAWGLCSATILVHCERAKTEHTNWASPTSVQVALVRRYSAKNKKRIIDNVFRIVTRKLRMPLVCASNGSASAVEPLSTEEWMSTGLRADVVENVPNGLVFLRAADSTVYRMDIRGSIEPLPLFTGSDREFLALGGSYARAYCLK